MLQKQGQEEDIFTANLWDTGPRDNLMGMLDLAITCTVDGVYRA